MRLHPSHSRPSPFGFAALALCVALGTAGASLPAKAEVEVDLELVLAVDISFSMDPEEQQLQRLGYVDGIVSKEVIDAIKAGVIGKIAVTYVEWAGAFEQRTIVPWTVIDGIDSAKAFANAMAEQPIRRVYRTSISGAIDYSVRQFDQNGYDGARKVIDVSGDGANNQGRFVTVSRDDALAKGVVINGLPIMLKRPVRVGVDIVNLDEYYRDCVIGGPNAFTVPVRSNEGFAEAIRKKLILEIANLAPAAPPVWTANVGTPIDCLAGERLWQERDMYR
jgi:hypothetical protein